MNIIIHTENTISTKENAVPFAKIINEQHGKTTLKIYGKGEFTFIGRSHIPAYSGSVSDLKINPAFVEFINDHI